MASIIADRILSLVDSTHVLEALKLICFSCELNLTATVVLLLGHRVPK